MSGVTFDFTDNRSLSDIDRILEKKKTQLVIKRVFDLALSSIGLVCLAPVLLAIAIIVKISSRGPAFFRQTRVGKDGKEFKILKFRTMIVQGEDDGLQLTIGRDKRITKVGYLLRKTKLDELPQLVNVLVGEMSFVGPRPEVPKYVALYNKEQRNILKIRPGITDLASIEYRDENRLLGQTAEPEKTYIKEIMPAKIVLNSQYLPNISVIYDLKLIIWTILSIVKGSKE